MMKIVRLFPVICMIAFSSSLFSQVAINTTGNAPDASAMLDISGVKGLLIPRMTNTERDALTTNGLIIYSTTDNKFYFRKGGSWSSIATQWTTSGSNIYYTSGSVGIGTSIPSTSLQVGGTSGSNFITLAGGSTGASYGINWSFTQPGTRYYGQVMMDYNTRSSKGLQINSGYEITFNDIDPYGVITNELMHIKNNTGYVGIGTSNPTSLLHVNGTFRVIQKTAALTDGAPTDAQIDSATGSTAADVGAGYKVTIKDSDGTGLLYLIESDGTDWFYTQMTKAL